MKRILALTSTLALLLAGCGNDLKPTNQSWTETPPDEGKTRPTVTMNSVLDENLYFKVKYDPSQWQIKETKGRYQTNLIFNHTQYEDETCYILPGTLGKELEKDYTVEPWSYKSEVTWGKDYQFINPVTKITEMWVFEAESAGVGFPTTLFELHVPTDGQNQDQCYEDWQQFIGTFEFDHYSGTPEDLEAILKYMEEQKKLNEEIEKQRMIEELKAKGQISEKSDGTESASGEVSN